MKPDETAPANPSVTAAPTLAEAEARMADAQRLVAAGASAREVHAALFAVADAQERAGYLGYANRMRAEANKLVPMFPLSDRQQPVRKRERRWWRRATA